MKTTTTMTLDEIKRKVRLIRDSMLNDSEISCGSPAWQIMTDFHSALQKVNAIELPVVPNGQPPAEPDAPTISPGHLAAIQSADTFYAMFTAARDAGACSVDFSVKFPVDDREEDSE